LGIPKSFAVSRKKYRDISYDIDGIGPVVLNPTGWVFPAMSEKARNI